MVSSESEYTKSSGHCASLNRKIREEFRLSGRVSETREVNIDLQHK